MSEITFHPSIRVNVGKRCAAAETRLKPLAHEIKYSEMKRVAEDREIRRAISNQSQDWTITTLLYHYFEICVIYQWDFFCIFDSFNKNIIIKITKRCPFLPIYLIMCKLSLIKSSHPPPCQRNNIISYIYVRVGW